jgi:paraquat-inducible protein B
MRQPSPRLVGIFVIGAVGLATAAVLTFASGTLFAQTFPFVAYFQESVTGLDPGAPVKFMGVQVGSVKGVSLSLSAQEVSLQDVRIPVVFEIDQNLLAAQGLTALSLSDTVRLRAMIDQGMRVEMGVESFVTGKKYLSLVVRPEEPVDLVGDPNVPYIELPSVRGTGLSDLQGDVQDALARLVRLQIDTVLLQMTRTLQSIDRVAITSLQPSLNSLPVTLAHADSTLESLRLLAARIDSGFVPLRDNMTAAMTGATNTSEELRLTAAALRESVGPDSPVLARLEETLNRLAAAGYAVEALAEYLARNPDALLRGKPVTPEPEMR